MGYIFLTAANAVLPIVLLIFIGYWLKQIGFLSEDFLDTGNKLVFRLFLPISLFVSVYTIESIQNLPWDVIVYCLIITLLIFVLGLVTAMWSTNVIQRRGVMLQCIFRSNFAIIGLPMASALGGAGAVAAAAIISAVSIPVFNMLAVISLSLFLGGSSGQGRMK